MPTTPVFLSAVSAPNYPVTLGPTAAGFRYQSISKIAEGGMGAVYRGQKLVEGFPPVAIKLALNTFAQPGELARFRREIATVIGLDHPHIVKTLDHGEDRRFGPFIVMELLQGETLEDFLNRQPYGRVSSEKSAALVLPVCSALLYAQVRETPLVHRDIKPANIFLSKNGKDAAEPLVKVMDFGLARDPNADPRGLGARQKLTEAGMALGTLQYIAPEQCDGKPGLASDVYALGVMLYLMIEGRFPFPENLQDPLELIDWHKRGTPAALTACKSAALKNLIPKMLAKKPAARPALGEVAATLDELTPVAKSRARTVLFPLPLATLAGFPAVEPLPHDAATSRCEMPVAAVTETMSPESAVTIRASSPVFEDPAVPQEIDDRPYRPADSAPAAVPGVIAGELSAVASPSAARPSDKVIVDEGLYEETPPPRNWLGRIKRLFARSGLGSRKPS